MALIGDIMIKVAADLGEFAAGMTEAVKKLDEFGEHSKKSGDTLSSFIGQVRGVFVASKIGEAVEAMINYGEQMQKTIAEMGTLAQTLGLSTDQLQAYQAAAIQAGVKTDVVTDAVTKFNRSIGEAAAGGKVQIDALNQLGVKILDASGQQRNQNDLLQEAASKLLAMTDVTKRATIEVALFGRSGQQTEAALKQLSISQEGLIYNAKQLGLVLDESVIKQMEELERKGQIAEIRMRNILALPYAQAKTTVFESMADGLEKLNRAVVANDTTKLALIMQLLLHPFDTIVTLSTQTAAGGGDPVAGQIKILEAQLKEFQDHLTAYQTGQGGTLLQRTFGDVATLNKNIDETIAKIAKLKAAQLGGSPEGSSTSYRPDPPKGSTNPAVAGTGDEAEAAIKRLDAQAKAAEKAYKDLLAGFNQPLEGLSRSVELQKQIDDMVAKLTASQKAAGYEDKIKAAATAADTWRQNLVVLQKAEADADATQRRLGDGTDAYTKILVDLNRAMATHRLSQDAYNRALKEQTEAAQQAALAAKGLDNNLGSLEAGFQHSADAYAKANSMYALGEQTFTGLTNAMSEGLDSLSGKSTKTFGQIAADFASMLAKMALQAAASQVFKYLFGTPTGDISGLSTDQQIAIFSSYGAPHAATGGPAYPGQSLIVGENGPERFVPTVAGAIVPMNGSSGGPSVAVNVDMSGSAPPSARQAADFARRMKQAVLDTINDEKRPGGTLYAGAR